MGILSKFFWKASFSNLVIVTDADSTMGKIVATWGKPQESENGLPWRARVIALTRDELT